MVDCEAPAVIPFSVINDEAAAFAKPLRKLSLRDSAGLRFSYLVVLEGT